MLEKVRKYVSKWHMLKKEDKVIVGVSGGADSVCLLFVLLELQKDIPFEIVVVHVNHGLRGEQADFDEAYVKKICKEQGVQCISYLKNVELIAKNRKQSTEEAGRDVRREIFDSVLKEYGGTKIALAHHKNDNVETFLMNLARGTGLKGLRGICPVTGHMIRPLLCVERKEIESFLKKRSIFYCIDKTNEEDEYTRNRIRNHVIPYLETEVNSNTVFHVNETMEQLMEIQEFLEEQTSIYYDTCVGCKGKRVIIYKEAFQKVPKVLKPLVLKEALVKITEKEKDIESIHLKVLQELFEKQVGKKADLPYEIYAQRSYDGVWMEKKNSRKEEKQKQEWEILFQNGNSEALLLGDCKIICSLMENISINGEDIQKNNTKCFDYDIISDRLCIRTRKAGDYITIHPDGKKQKLKAYFINEKIPQDQRDKILLVADGSHILWIIGYRTNCMYQVSRNTKRILQIKMDKGESHGREN